ncbi:MAG: radical SAM protein [Verrucomicrobiota bacterium]
MKITLISPRLAIQKGDFFGSGVLYWPLELAVLAAFLRQDGQTPAVIDLLGNAPFTLEDRGDHYLQGKAFDAYAPSPAVCQADIFIIYALSYMSHGELLSIAANIRRIRCNAVIAVLENSQAVTSYSVVEKADEFFRHGVNILLCGEVYWNWNEIRSYLERPDSVPVPPNILTPATPSHHAVQRVINRHPSYPVPGWDLFPLRNYWKLPYSHGPKTRKYLPILTSRGCPFPCDFCVSPEMNQSVWRGRSPEEVVGEMIVLRDRFGVRNFQVEDLNPTVDNVRWLEICRLLIARNAGVYFYFVSGTKAETIRVADIPLYAKAGCRYISISPESGSPAVLKAMGKSFDYAHGLNLIRACRRHGIYTQACLLVGHPAEDIEAHRLSCDYIRHMVRAGVDEIGVFIVAPLPGSRLAREGKIDFDLHKALVSFSPKGRTGWAELGRRRGVMVRTFILEKLKRGPGIWIQGLRALLGVPRTKMENLPRRIVWMYGLMLKNHLANKR